MNEKGVQPGPYRHCKGNEYSVVGTARHSETLEELVVYRQQYGEHGLWVRPKHMFSETVKSMGRRFLVFSHWDRVGSRSATTSSMISRSTCRRKRSRFSSVPMTCALGGSSRTAMLQPQALVRPSPARMGHRLEGGSEVAVRGRHDRDEGGGLYQHPGV